MAHYRENFDLDEADIELIENTIRNEISRLTGQKLEMADKESEDAQEIGASIHRLNTLLGKLHNQKIWYSQVNQTGVPLG